jgi:aminotransferase
MNSIVNPAVAFMDESIIREMTRVAEDSGAVNLAQGYPEHPIPDPVRSSVHAAIREGHNDYTRTWGDPRLREQLSSFILDHWQLAYDPEDEVVITCGASEAIMASLLALLPHGARAVIPEPVYENYVPAVRLAGATPVIVTIDPFTHEWDPVAMDDACRGAQVLVLNTPGNPTGKVWSADEIETLAEILERHDTLLVTDETYAFITDPSAPHVPPATVARLYERTVTIASFSKTYAVTGWRVGFAAAPARLMAAIRKVHDFMTVCAPAPSQRALVEALRLPESYYSDLAALYRSRYTLLADGLEAGGWSVNHPKGSYFLVVDVSHLGIDDDREWAAELARTQGVAGVPGSAFLWNGLPHEDREPDRRGTFLRLSFGKREELLEEAVRRLGSRG